MKTQQGIAITRNGSIGNVTVKATGLTENPIVGVPIWEAPRDNGKVLAINSNGNGYNWVSMQSGGSSLPADPAADGTYFLSTTVSSGTATQSWVSIPAASGNNF